MSIFPFKSLTIFITTIIKLIPVLGYLPVGFYWLLILFIILLIFISCWTLYSCCRVSGFCYLLKYVDTCSWGQPTSIGKSSELRRPSCRNPGWISVSATALCRALGTSPFACAQLSADLSGIHMQIWELSLQLSRIPLLFTAALAPPSSVL